MLEHHEHDHGAEETAVEKLLADDPAGNNLPKVITEAAIPTAAAAFTTTGGGPVVEEKPPLLKARKVSSRARIIWTLTRRAQCQWSPSGMCFTSAIMLVAGAAIAGVTGTELSYGRFQSDVAMMCILLGVVMAAAALQLFHPGELLVYGGLVFLTQEIFF